MAARIPSSSLDESPRSVSEAFTRVVDLSERVVMDEFRMLVLQSQDRLSGFARRTASIALTAFFLLHAWGLMLAGVSILAVEMMPISIWLLCLAALHALIGGILWLLARAQTRKALSSEDGT